MAQGQAKIGSTKIPVTPPTHCNGTREKEKHHHQETTEQNKQKLKKNKQCKQNNATTTVKNKTTRKTNHQDLNQEITYKKTPKKLKHSKGYKAG